MKKLLFTALMLTALLAATVGTAFAGSALELVGVSHNGGGISFTFRVNGEFSADELASGFVQVQGGDDFPLYCSQTAPDEVVCHTSKKTAGHDVVVGFGGARFWTDIPAEWVAPSTGCFLDEGYFVCPYYIVNGTFPGGTGFVQDGYGYTGWVPVNGDWVDFGYDPNGWGPWAQYNDGSIPFPGSGFPSVGPGWYQ